MDEKKRQEIVFAVATTELLSPVNFLLQGFDSDPDKCRALTRAINNSKEFVNWQRWRLEENPLYQQPIPYVMVCKDGKLLCYRRRECGDFRLLGKASVGIGGHVNTDEDKDDIMKATRRELNEELMFNGKTLSEKDVVERIYPAGILKDWRDPVGAVHVGVVMAFDATGLEIEAREEGIHIGWIDNTDEYMDSTHGLPNLEGWSEMILKKYNKLKHEERPWTKLKKVSSLTPPSSSETSQESTSSRKAKTSSPLPVSRKRPRSRS